MWFDDRIALSSEGAEVAAIASFRFNALSRGFSKLVSSVNDVGVLLVA